jgi:hypothetical protein
MAIVQKNLYLPGQNLTNLALNADLNRLGDDKTNITIDFGTTPATITIKVGSIIEVNGNCYAIEGIDYSFQMANATHNYITFTDNPNPSFSSAPARGTYTQAKCGFYQVDNLTRTLSWYINQTDSVFYRDLSIYFSQGNVSRVNDAILNSYAATSGAALTLVNTTITNTEYSYNMLLKKPALFKQYISFSTGSALVTIIGLVCRLDSVEYSMYDSQGIVGSITKIHILNPGYYRFFFRNYSGGNTYTIILSLGGVYGKDSIANITDILENI